MDRLAHLPVGANRNGRFCHNHDIALRRLGDFFGGGHHIGQVRVAVAPAGRRSDGDEDRLCPLHRFVKISGKAKPSGSGVLREKILKTRLKDRHFAGL